MGEPVYLGAYWSARAEDVDSCVRRMKDCLDRLAAIHPALSLWYERGGRRKAVSEPVGSATDELVRLMLAGRNRTDLGHEVIEALGFSIHFWNQNRLKMPAVISVNCGAFSPHVQNTCVLDLPDIENDGDNSFYEPENCTAMMLAVTQSWEPDWALLTTDALQAMQQPSGSSPSIGWLTYLSRTRTSRAAPPGRVTTPNVHTRETDKGVLYTAGNDIRDPSHLDIALALREELRRRGSL
jgi:hypothetical protein